MISDKKLSLFIIGTILILQSCVGPKQLSEYLKENPYQPHHEAVMDTLIKQSESNIAEKVNVESFLGSSGTPKIESVKKRFFTVLIYTRVRCVNNIRPSSIT